MPDSHRNCHKTARRPLVAAAMIIGIALPTVADAQIRPTPLPAPIPSNPVARPQPLPAPMPPVARPQPLPAPVPPSQSGRYFAGTVRCESQNFRPRTCRARTQNRVEIVQVHGGSCRRGSSFQYDGNSITVTEGCRATFAYGYGNVRPKADNGSGALPWVLAGAGATAGIVALANSGNDKPAEPARPAPPPPPPPPPPPAAPLPVPPAPAPAPEPAPDVPQGPFPSLPPARIDANIQMLTADQQRSAQTCLFEGARQVGVAGGSALAMEAVEQIVAGNGGWRFTMRGNATFPNGTRGFRVLCRATPTQIVEFTVTPI